mgnify:CR=1 FL=1
MMNNGDMAVPKESLDMILSYINRAEVRVRRCAHVENYIFPTVVKGLFNRVGESKHVDCRNPPRARWAASTATFWAARALRRSSGT